MRLATWIALGVLAGCGLSDPQLPEGSVVGTWGGKDAGFIVDDTSAHAHIGCTKGDVHQAITLDPSGRFDVEGDYNVDAYPVDRGIVHPARFIGVVEGRRLTLTVVLTDTVLSLGPVTLFYNREPEMSMCPICRPADDAH